MPSTYTIWLIVFLALTVLIYGMYGFVLGFVDYPGKDEKYDVVALLLVGSAVTFLISGALVALGSSSTSMIAATVLMFSSIMADYIVGGMVGTVEEMPDGSVENSGWLVTATYMPMMLKTILLAYVSYMAGAGGGKVLPGQAALGVGAKFRFKPKTGEPGGTPPGTGDDFW